MPVMCGKKQNQTKEANKLLMNFTGSLTLHLFCAAGLLPLRSLQGTLGVFSELILAKSTI